jgi:hypothetical protein
LPTPSLPEPDEFKSALLEYGKAVIKSTIDHSPAEEESLVWDMRATKQNVMSTHDDMLRELKTKLSISEESNRQLHDTITTQEDAQAIIEGQLKGKGKLPVNLEGSRG